MPGRAAMTNTHKTKITLENTFHNTEVTVIAWDGIISASSIARAKHKLCGVSGCTCGGIRGAPELEYDQDGSAKIMEQYQSLA